MRFYTHVGQHYGNLRVRGYEDGRRFHFEVPYEPYLFQEVKEQSDYKLIDGYTNVGRIDYRSIKDARMQIEKAKMIGRKTYGMTQWAYPFIYDNFPGTIEFDMSVMSICSIDIEIGGMYTPGVYDKVVTAITVIKDKQIYTLGLKPYKAKRPGIKYRHCKDEATLLETFLKLVAHLDPDVWTGWNIEMFDIPYLYNRIELVLGEQQALKMSPWKQVNDRVINNLYGSYTTKELIGVTIYDYMQLYKKFANTPQESYSLEHIAQYELKSGKLDYGDYGTLTKLYEENHDLYIDYNIRDTELIFQLEDRLKFIYLALTVAYDAKVNPIDALTTVRLWDVIIHNYLMDRGIVVPPMASEENRFAPSIAGGYVKQPQEGLFKWIVSFDFDSLYPHLMMMFNISPDMLDVTEEGITVDNLLGGLLNSSNMRDMLETEDRCIAGTGCMFLQNKRGFLADLMENTYALRVQYKNQMKDYIKENTKKPSNELEVLINRFDKMQHAKKIQMNSAYGALANAYFRWFDVRLAESVTKSGQLATRWVERAVNKYLNDILNTENIDYVIACDTDSMYLTLDKWVESLTGNFTTEELVEKVDQFAKTTLQRVINDATNELAKYVNAHSNKLRMKREVIADKGIWSGKKHYVLNVWDDEGLRLKIPKLKVKGLESERSSTPAICRKALKEGYYIALNHDKDAFLQFVEQFRTRFMSGTYEEVSFPRSVNRMSEYSSSTSVYEKGTPIAVKGALIYNHLLKMKNLDNYEPISSGSKIKFCYMTQPNPYGLKVISAPRLLPKELALDKYIDYDTQFEKAFLDPITTIVTHLGWSPNSEPTLEEFCK